MPESIEALIASRLAGAAQPQGTRPPAAPAGAEGAKSFREVLERHSATRPQPVTFSRPAAARLERRAKELDGTQQRRLEEAVDRAQRKGARDSLVLMDDLALVVNVRDRIVVTAMDGASRKEGVFTNIDSVVMI